MRSGDINPDQKKKSARVFQQFGNFEIIISQCPLWSTLQDSHAAGLTVVTELGKQRGGSVLIMSSL